MQTEGEDKVYTNPERTGMKKFADFAKGAFFLSATASLAITMYMFIYVWQPIWVEGFEDFHTISQSINNLNSTAKPASATVPLMLYEMEEMNSTMNRMQATMLDMNGSMHNLEAVTPNIAKMTTSMEHIDYSLNAQMGRMNYQMGEIENKFSPFGMMPFNW